MKTKTILTSLLFLFTSILLMGQTPNSMKYQAIARDISGEPLKNQMISLRISILKDSETGLLEFKEIHTKLTNEFGVVDLEIGLGDDQQGTLSAIPWGLGTHFLKVELDTKGGSDFIFMGSTQLITVPYAFFANNGVQYNQDLACDESTEGMVRYNYDTHTIEVCNGEAWVGLGQGSSGFNCGEPLIDARDGNSYATVQIGTQCWMADNLNYGVFKESIFTNEDHSDVSNNGVVEKYSLDNDENNLITYGALYDWNEMMNYSYTEASQGICPDGWHIPTFDEWVAVEEHLGGALEAGKKLKAGGTSGFNFRLSGSRTAKGLFSGQGESSGTLWTSTPSASHPDSRAYNRNFLDNADNIQHNSDLMLTGKSVRCIKN